MHRIANARMKTGDTDAMVPSVARTPSTYIWKSAISKESPVGAARPYNDMTPIVGQRCIDLLKVFAEAVQKSAKSHGIEEPQGCSQSPTENDCEGNL